LAQYAADGVDAYYVCSTGGEVGTLTEVAWFILLTYGLKFTVEKKIPMFVPQAIIAFLESKDYGDAVRKAVSFRGDSDTVACMPGGMAKVYCGRIEDHIIKEVRQILERDLLTIVDEFNNRHEL